MHHTCTKTPLQISSLCRNPKTSSHFADFRHEISPDVRLLHARAWCDILSWSSACISCRTICMKLWNQWLPGKNIARSKSAVVHEDFSCPPNVLSFYQRFSREVPLVDQDRWLIHLNYQPVASQSSLISSYTLWRSIPDGPHTNQRFPYGRDSLNLTHGYLLFPKQRHFVLHGGSLSVHDITTCQSNFPILPLEIRGSGAFPRCKSERSFSWVHNGGSSTPIYLH